MIYPQTILNVIDNSGAAKVYCIKLLKASTNSGAKPGDIVVVSVRNLTKNNKKLKKGMIFKALILRSKKYITKLSGIKIKSNENAVILLNAKNMPIGTRITGPIYKNIKLQHIEKFTQIKHTVI